MTKIIQIAIPTTFEMDGLLTQEDIDNQYTVVFQCRSCRHWTAHYNHAPGGKNDHIPCYNCGKIDYDDTSIKSLRSYNKEADSQRKLRGDKGVNK